METEASDNGAEKIRDMQPVILLEENASNIMIMRLRKQKCFSSFSSRQNRRVLKRIIGACGRAPRASPNAAMTRTEVYAIHSFRYPEIKIRILIQPEIKTLV